MPRWKTVFWGSVTASVVSMATVLVLSFAYSTGYDRNPCVVETAAKGDGASQSEPAKPETGTGPGGGQTAPSGETSRKPVILGVYGGFCKEAARLGQQTCTTKGGGPKDTTQPGRTPPDKEPGAAKPLETPEVSFGQPICVQVAGLDKLAADPKKPLILFLDGQPMQQIVGSVIDRARGLVRFELQRSAKDADAWSKLIGKPPFGGEVEHVAVGVGTSEGVGTDGRADVIFVVYRWWVMLAGLFSLACAVGALVPVALRTAILRDHDVGSQYSLARVQMTWWLYLVTAAFLYVWLVTGEANGVVTPQALTLLGISGTTALASVMVAGGARQPSRGIVKDLVSESAAPSVHRVQIVIWTMILGVVFLWEVYANFRMPEFDANLLIMTGISSGLYVGFKAAEK